MCPRYLLEYANLQECQVFAKGLNRATITFYICTETSATEDSETAKRIIFIPFIDAFGGAERLVLDLSKFLHEREAPHVLVCFKQTIDLESYAEWPLQIHQINPKRNPIAEARALYEFLKSTKRTGGGLPLLFDLKSAFYSGVVSAGPFSLHLTDPPSLLPADISKYSFSARRNHEGFENPRSSGIVRALRAELVHHLNGRGVRRAERVIVMTEKIRRELQQLYRVDSLVIRPGVPASGFLRKSGAISKNPLRLLSVSRLESSKRIDWVLGALAALNANKSLNKADWVFEIVGDGPAADSLKKVACDLGLADRTLFLGHVSGEDLAKAYSRAGLFIMPAVQGYGLPALEALRRGIPTIVHKDSGVSEILGGSPWAELVDGDNRSLAIAIGSMMDRLQRKTFSEFDMPRVPTNSEWAKEVCLACGWTEVLRN